MAQFEAKRLDESKINGGNRYNVGDGVSEEAINAPIEGVLYAQNFLDVAMEKSQIALDGFHELKEKQSEQDKQIEENSQNTKLLYNIVEQKGFIRSAEIEQAYTSRETAAGQNIVDEQETDVLEIKGKTVSCKNLIPYHYVFETTIFNDVTFDVNSDGSITLRGTATADGDILLQTMPVSPNYTYALSGLPFNDGGYSRLHFFIESGVHCDDYGYGAGGSVYHSGTSTTANLYFYVHKGTTYNGTIYPMVNLGETALPYQPYFTGLKHAYIDSIKSTGRNLIDHSTYTEMPATYNGVTFTKNTDGSIRVKGFCNGESFVVLTERISISPNCQYTLSGYQGDSDGDSRLHIDLGSGFSYNDYGHSVTFVAPAYMPRTILYFHISNGVTYDTTLYPMLNLGASKLPYEPYTEETYQLPQTLELGEYDSFNPQTGEITRGTGKQSYNASSVMSATDKRNSVWYYLIGKPFGSTVYTAYMNEFVPSKFTIREVVNSWDDAAMIGAISASGDSFNFYVGFPPDTTMEEAQAAIDGLEIEYKLKTPTTETIANAPKGYKVHNHGSETVNQGTTDNSKFGAMPTITNEYMIIL